MPPTRSDSTVESRLRCVLGFSYSYVSVFISRKQVESPEDDDDDGVAGGAAATAICVSTVHCSRTGTHGATAFDANCYKTSVLCKKNCAPSCKKKYNLKGRCKEAPPPHSYICWMCRCYRRATGAAAIASRAYLLHSIYALCVAALVIYVVVQKRRGHSTFSGIPSNTFSRISGKLRKIILRFFAHIKASVY